MAHHTSSEEDSVHAATGNKYPTTYEKNNTYSPDEKDIKHSSSDPELAGYEGRGHPNLLVQQDVLARRLSARQVQMIAIAGTIGTGLFLGTGRSLARGGPASMLICYALTGAVIFITMLALGEMAAFIPIAGSFCTYAGRFIDDSVGFALTWNYWANDAIAVASDLVALQLLLDFWDAKIPGWGLALIVWAFLIGANIITVRLYGELEYWMSILKVGTIIVFIFLGIAVNCGGNTDHTYIGGKYWGMGDAPFVNGIGGFASVFVTASFAYGGTESIAITAGETKNPTKNMPRVVKNVFWRIMIFYIISVLLIGLNVPYTYPKLSTKSAATSPFTIVFTMAGSNVAGSFMNAVIMTSVISAGNHALFAGTRLLYALAKDRHAPQFFSKLNRNKVPWIAVLATSSISLLCFGASYIGAGQLWTWLQNLVGVSNQIAWLFINITSIRFRRGLEKQGKTHLLPFKNYLYPYGQYLVIVAITIIIGVQGWTAFSPRFNAIDFVSYYIQIPLMILFITVWKLIKRTKFVRLEDMDLETDVFVVGEEERLEEEREKTAQGKVRKVLRWIF